MMEFLHLLCFGTFLGCFTLFVLNGEGSRRFELSNTALRWYGLTAMTALIVGSLIGRPEMTLAFMSFGWTSWLVVLSATLFTRSVAAAPASPVEVKAADEHPTKS